MSSTHLFTSLDVGQKQKNTNLSELVNLIIKLCEKESEITSYVTNDLFVIDRSGQVIYL